MKHIHAKAGLLVFTLCVFLCNGTLASSPVKAAGEEAPTGNVQFAGDQSSESGNEPAFTYQLEDRKDPFNPFLTPKATTSSVDMNEIIDTVGQLTGMQLFEPGQLNLVALLQTNEERVAMVEDVTGKGYIISPGTKIGKRGVVKDIIPNKVLIEETAFTRAGKKIVTQIVMVLKKEGEE